MTAIQVFDNGEAGIVIRNTRNVTFEAPFDDYSSGQGYVGSDDGQQPIDIIIEGESTMITFDHMGVRSSNGEWRQYYSLETGI